MIEMMPLKFFKTKTSASVQIQSDCTYLPSQCALSNNIKRVLPHINKFSTDVRAAAMFLSASSWQCSYLLFLPADYL